MLTQAIKIGMSPYEFWHCDSSLYYNYLDAYEDKQKQEMNQLDFLAWKQGLYVLRAIAVNNPLVKDSEPYPNEPDFIKENNKKKNTVSEEERLEFEQQIALAQFEQFGRYAELYNKQYFGEEEG